jgi:protein-S-isoprenylcysteine O-methyltransferase Ste14
MHRLLSDVPRRTGVRIGVLFWLVGIPLGHGFFPWAIARVGRHIGWPEGRPGIWNLLGLLLVGAGFVGLGWVFWTGMMNRRRLPERLQVGLAPVILLTTGPFAQSRNPMYVCALSLWSGWSVFYGSWPVALTTAGFWVLMTRVIVPREERSLEAAFGENYTRYQRSVPRWFGRGSGRSDGR